MEPEPQPPVLLRPEVRAIQAYRQGVPAPADGFKLSSNEVALDPLPSVVQRVAEATDFNRYADASMLPLRTELAKRFDVTIDEVHVASGSVAILYQLVHAAVGSGEEYIFAWPSFEAYPGLGLASGAVAVSVALNPDLTHNLAAMAEAITEKTRLIILCSPNNPTGPAIDREEFIRFMNQVPRNVLVILDEAYREFITSETAVFGEEVLHEYPQLVLLRTFSKAYGLAGLRIGYAVGHATILNAARATGIPLSVTKMAHEGAIASLEPVAEAELFERITVIAVQRDALAEQLRQLGFNVPDAQGNFVWLQLGNLAADFAQFFAQHGTVTRAFPGHGVRVSIGEEESIPRVLELASKFMDEHPQLREEG